MGSDSAALLLTSMAGLFLELLLIRWIGTEVRIFAYLQNTVLVVCFLGLGMGSLTCRRPVVMRQVVVPLSLILLLMALPWTRPTLRAISEMLSGFSGYLIWYPGQFANWWTHLGLGVLGLVLTFLVMLMIWQAFVPIGRLMGRLIDDHPKTIAAYSINVAGSLLGVWLFVSMSALQSPPWTWFALAACMLLPLGWADVRARSLDVALLIVMVGLSWAAGLSPGAMEVHWSPYQKLTVSRPTGPEDVGKLLVHVNNAGYQMIFDLRPQHVAAHPEQFDPEMRGLSQYDLPALLHPNPQRMLIVGTGTGNDVAGALRKGAGAVVAVEIDPAIIDIGRRHHPERPYDDPRVEVVIDDARSYFASSPPTQFDVIAFGLLDSHTTTAMTNARLDHYVYTEESIQRARELLKPGGIMVMSFEAQKPFISDRMGSALRRVFDQEPICFRIRPSAFGWGGVMFIAGDLEAARSQVRADPNLDARLASWLANDPIRLTGSVRVASDDWPYLYLERPTIPFLYLCLTALMILLGCVGLRRIGASEMLRAWDRSSWHFFFLGTAFLLLEVQNISKAAVVLGSTWEVNAVIISGILFVVLLANLTAAKFPSIPERLAYVSLLGLCAGLYFVDLSRFAFLPYATKAVVVGLLTSLPMYFSGIVFIRSFASVSRRDAALGANLIGALVGGLLQTATFLLGIKALLLMVMALYAAAFLTRPINSPAPQPVHGTRQDGRRVHGCES